MENVHFFTSRTDINIHFWTSTNSSSKPYEYHWALCPTGMILNIYSEIACNFSASSLDLAHNRFTLNSATSSSYFRVEIWSPVRKTFSIYSRESNRSITIFSDSIDATYWVGGKLKWYVWNNDITLRQSTTSYYLVWNNIELNDIDNIIDIDINLWNWEDCKYQDTTSFKKRYPLVKIGENNNAYYQPTDTQSLSTDRTYTFLTMIGHSYTSDTDQWDFIDGYCTNIKLETSNSAKNDAPKNETVKLEAVNTNSSTQEINGYETYIGPDNKILDRQRIHPYGSQSAQISLISSLSESAIPLKPYYIQKDTNNEKILPRAATYARTNPLVLCTSLQGNFNEEDIVWLDYFHLFFKNNTTIRLPLNWTVRYYSRKALNTSFNIINNWFAWLQGKVIIGERPFPTYTWISEPTLPTTVTITNDYVNTEINIRRNGRHQDLTINWNISDLSLTSTKINVNIFRFVNGGLLDPGVELSTGYWMIYPSGDMKWISRAWDFQIQYTLKDVPFIPGCPDLNNLPSDLAVTDFVSKGGTCLWGDSLHQTGNWIFRDYIQQKGGSFGSNRVLGGIQHIFSARPGMCGSFTQTVTGRTTGGYTMQVFDGDNTRDVSVDMLDIYDNDQAGFLGQIVSYNTDTVKVLVAYPEE